MPRSSTLIRDSAEMWAIFKECFDKIADLMKEQIVAAIRDHIKVDKVLLVGGFADNRALQQHLRSELGEINKLNKTNVKLIVDDR